MSLRLAVLLAASLDASLAAAVWAVLHTPIETAPIAPPQRPAAAAAAAPGDSAIDLAALARNHVLARPLFAESRRAWQPPAPPAPAPAPVFAPPDPAPAPRLVGIGVSGGHARALLAAPDDGETLWVGVGETAWSWTVREIAAGSVTLERGTRRVPISLYPEEG